MPATVVRGSSETHVPSSSASHDPELNAQSDFDSKSFRRSLNKSELYNRSGFGHKQEMLDRINEEYTS